MVIVGITRVVNSRTPGPLGLFWVFIWDVFNKRNASCGLEKEVKGTDMFHGNWMKRPYLFKSGIRKSFDE
jgi:hypothetical protein